MSKSIYAAVAIALTASMASAHHEEAGFGQPAPMMTSLPGEQWTVTNWYKQTVYDPNDKSIGEIKDVLLDHEGKVSAFIMGVGGFLGIGEKDVAVPFNAVMFKHKNNNSQDWTLYMNASKDVVSQAPSYKFDRATRTWMAATPASSTVGGPPAQPATPRAAEPMPRPQER